MKKTLFLAVILAAAALFSQAFAAPAQAAFANGGKVLLDVENKGQAWYVSPTDGLRYPLIQAGDADIIIKKTGLGISELNFQKIAQAGTAAKGDLVLAKKLAGRIVLRVEMNGESWYINPKDLKRYYLGSGASALAALQKTGQGISRRNLAKIHKAGDNDSANTFSNVKYSRVISTPRGKFTADIVEINLSRLRLKVATDTAGVEKCSANCPAKPLIDYALDQGAFAAVNGSYFDTVSRKNYYFAPFYNSRSRLLMNADQTKYPTTGPVAVFDENSKFYYFSDSRLFKSQADFEKLYGVKMQAAFSNLPRLVEEKKNVLEAGKLDSKQRYTKTNRLALVYKNDGSDLGTLYILAVRNATVPDLAAVAVAQGADYALNLDGGYSAALYYNGQFVMGPGRDVPNAILFLEK